MDAESFARFAKPFPEPHLLVQSDGVVVAMNPAAARLLGAGRTPDGNLSLYDVAAESADQLEAFLRNASGSGALVPGALALTLQDGEARKFRCEGAVVRPASPSEPALLLLRMHPREEASRNFLMLNERIAHLHRELHDRRQSQELLQTQAAELEELATELEQTIEELERRGAEAQQARTSAERAAERARFLAEAGHILASSLDYESTLRTVARLAVPRIADWCTVHLVDGQGQVRNLEVAHADPARVRTARELEERFPSDPHRSGSALGRVLFTGSSELFEEIQDEVLEAAARSPEHLQMLRELQLRSAMVVPLTAHGRTLGAFTLVAAESDRRFGPADLALAEALAVRAGLAIDNARLYEEAREASRAKSDFLATMSHELRTPLNAMMGYADLLLAGIPEPLPEVSRQRVERINVSARHLRSLIDEILTFSRIEAGEEKQETEAIPLRPMLEEVATFIEPLALGRGIAFEVRAPEDPGELETDPRKLRQILLNLLSNAVKFTEKGGVTLSLTREDDQVQFRIEDTGIGIAPEHLERIFDPFWQAKAGTTRTAGGTGLGLTVALRLTRLLGGELQVESAVGNGSTFTVRFPASQEGAGG